MLICAFHIASWWIFQLINNQSSSHLHSPCSLKLTFCITNNQQTYTNSYKNKNPYAPVTTLIYVNTRKVNTFLFLPLQVKVPIRTIGDARNYKVTYVFITTTLQLKSVIILLLYFAINLSYKWHRDSSHYLLALEILLCSINILERCHYNCLMRVYYDDQQTTLQIFFPRFLYPKWLD